jgi:hypothetical protein
MANSVDGSLAGLQAVAQQGKPLQNARRRKTTTSFARPGRRHDRAQRASAFILLGTVFCFIASSMFHMLPLWHKDEFPQLPDEEKARGHRRALNVPPGDYMLPRCKSMKEMA